MHLIEGIDVKLVDVIGGESSLARQNAGHMRTVPEVVFTVVGRRPASIRIFHEADLSGVTGSGAAVDAKVAVCVTDAGIDHRHPYTFT